MKKRTKYLIFIFLTLFGLYFLFPTIKWYFMFSANDRLEASLVGDSLKEDINGKVNSSIELLKDKKAPKQIMAVVNKKFIKEITDINRVIKRGLIDLIDDTTKIPDQEITVKKEYTYDEMKGILSEIKVKEKYVDSFFTDTLEEYFLSLQAEKKKVKDGIIKLGLDLQGGAYAVVTINFDDPAVKKKLEIMIDQEKQRDASLNDKELKKIINKYKTSMIDSAILKIDNRINKYGLSETAIQKLNGQDKIVINLPGVKEVTELRQIIETVGVLEFKLVHDEATQYLNKLIIDARNDKRATFSASGALLPEIEKQLKEKYPGTEALLEGEKNKWGEEEVVQNVYAVESTSLLGDDIKITNATVQPSYTGQYHVNFQMDSEATKDWAQITEEAAKTSRRIAIILDNVILYAPTVKEKIPYGQSSITLGNTPLSELNNLALILRSGSLNVPLEISEEHTVGASLGRDTIQKGIMAILYGFVFVLIFMLIWYNLGGAIADFAMILNLLIMFGGLAMFKATLTLPGMAGIILTVGMAVDANVIIFERIKEEFRAGKTFATALHLGFDKAFWTVMDANLTTFAAGIGLSLFGTGPIKGFAVTLCLGIVISLFTSLFVSRLIFDSIMTFVNFKSLKVLSLVRGK